MKIHDIPGFPNPLRIRIVLAEKGLAAGRVREGRPARRRAQGRRLPALNPLGTVPVLELDDGLCISECTAITEYLDNLDGDPILTGKTAAREGRHPHDAAPRRVRADRPDRRLFPPRHTGPGSGIAGAQEPRLERPRRVGPASPRQGRRRHALFRRRAEDQPYVAGDRFSMADITVLQALVFAGYAKIAVPEDCAALIAWNARLQERPSVKTPA
jgi:glutathione S-transferase